MVDMYCRKGMQLAASWLRTACQDGANREARAAMSFASLLGGLSLANAGLGVVHGFAAPIGGMFDAPHGAVCAALLPHGMQGNIAAIRDRAPQQLDRYREVAVILTGDPHASPDDAVNWVLSLTADLGIPPLRAYGIDASHGEDVCAKAAQASSMKANAIPLRADELALILRAAL